VQYRDCSQEHADKKEVLQALSSQQQQRDATATHTTSTSKVRHFACCQACCALCTCALGAAAACAVAV
jgi:hypothetical protein